MLADGCPPGSHPPAVSEPGAPRSPPLPWPPGSPLVLPVAPWQGGSREVLHPWGAPGCQGAGRVGSMVGAQYHGQDESQPTCPAMGMPHGEAGLNGWRACRDGRTPVGIRARG